MTAEQLRNSILQEAISGRLVPQDPNDEPASVFLQRIREEKARLVKEGKLKKKDLVETPIKEEEIPFEIPDNWEWVRLSTYVDVRDGTHDSPKYHPSGIPFVTSKNLKNGRIDFSTCTFISQSDHDKFSERSYVEDGDILFAMIGSIGNPVIVAKDREFSVKNVALFKRYSREYTNNKYLYHYLSYIQNELKQIAAGGVQSFVGLGTLRQYLIPLPPLAEQKRIVAKLEELLPIVEQYGKAQKELDELNAALPARLRQSILQEAISGHLVPQDPNDEPASALLARIREEKARLVKEGKLKAKDIVVTPITVDDIPYEIPNSWEWVRVKELFNVCSARRVHEKDWRSSGIPFYRAREIGKLAEFGHVDNDLYIDQELYNEFSKSGVPQENDLMVTAVGTLGRVYVVKANEIFYYKDGSVLCMENRFGINAKFAKLVIESPVFVSQYIGESQGTTVATLTMVRMNEYLLPLPPLAEQQRIVAKIEELFAEIDKITK